MPFAVNVLREDQQDLAIHFSRTPEGGRFAGVEWAEDSHSLPLLGGAVASFACLLGQVIDAGDHYLLIGAVEEIRRQSGRALVWCESSYHSLPAPRL